MRTTRQNGVGLIEVLIALLVFSIGMLGIASLQVVSIKTTFEAQQRYEATVLVDDLLARMKGSGMTPAEAEQNYAAFTFNSSNAPDASSVDDCSAIDSGCTLAQIAAWDIYQWKVAIAANAVTYNDQQQGLLGAMGCLSYPGGGVAPRVTVAWQSMTEMKDAGGVKECDTGAGGKHRHYSGPRRKI